MYQFPRKGYVGTPRSRETGRLLGSRHMFYFSKIGKSCILPSACGLFGPAPLDQGLRPSYGGRHARRRRQGSLGWRHGADFPCTVPAKTTRCTSWQEGLFSMRRARRACTCKFSVHRRTGDDEQGRVRVRCHQGGSVQSSISQLLPPSVKCIESTRRDAVCFGTGTNSAAVSGVRKYNV